MEAKYKTLLATVLLLISATLLLWWLLHDDKALAPATSATSAAMPQAVAKLGEPVLAVEAKPEAAIALDPVAAPARNLATIATHSTATLQGRCVDATGTPLAGCKASLYGGSGDEQRMADWLQDHPEKPEWQNPPPLLTGSDGRFVFTFRPPPPYQFTLQVTRDGHALMTANWPRFAPGSATDVGDIVMPEGVQVRGRVVDTRGEPQAKVNLSFGRADARNRSQGEVAPQWGTQVISDANGGFRTSQWLLPGNYRISTMDREQVSPSHLDLSTERPMEEVTVVVVAAMDTVTIRGRIVDDSGAPVVHARIRAEDKGGTLGNTYSNRQGDFELRRKSESTSKTAMLTVESAAGHEVDERPREVPWGSTDVEIRVARAASLTLRITDQQHLPVTQYTVRLLPRNRSGSDSRDSRARAQGQHADGVVVLPNVTSGEWLLVVDFPTAKDLQSLFVPFQQQAGSQRFDLVAKPTVARPARVVGTDNAPIAGVLVQLCDSFELPFDDRRVVMRRKEWVHGADKSALVLFEGTTTADGRIELRGPADRTLAVCLPGPGHLPLRQDDVRLDRSDELVIRVSRGARLVGKVVPPAAVAELKKLASLQPEDSFSRANRPRLGLVNAQHQRFPRDYWTAQNLTSLEIADDGAFDAVGLEPGDWQIVINAMRTSPGGGGHGMMLGAGDVILTDGVTTLRDLDLSYLLPGTLEGLVLHNGHPLANNTVILVGLIYTQSTTTDDQGRFHIQLPSGEYQLRYTGKPGSDAWMDLSSPTPAVVLRDQSNRQTFAITSSTLKIKVLDANGQPVAGVSLQGVVGDEAVAFLPPTDEDGVTSREVPTNTLTLQILPKELASPAAQQKLRKEARVRGEENPLASRWIRLQTVELRAGQQTDVEVRLPATAGY